MPPDALTELRMPRLSDSMEEGTILAWLRSPGDPITRGEELVEIETDKASMVHESDVAGTLHEIVAPVGATVRVGGVIALIDATDAPAANDNRERAPGSGRATDGRLKVSPTARRLAAELGVELAPIAGSGPGGRIVKSDVERAAAAASATSTRGEHTETVPVPARSQRLELTRLQRSVASTMARSKATAPHFQLETEIDMTLAAEARAALKELVGPGELVPTITDMIIRTCAIALREHPRVNASYRDDAIELHQRVNVGVAVAADDALLVPTVFDADRKSLREIAAETDALRARARDGSITPPELSGGTFTVSNLGMYGVTNFAPIINPPQAAILAVGAIVERPVVRQGRITTAQLMAVTLACDHRSLYGADGAAFLARVRALLESPFGLTL